MNNVTCLRAQLLLCPTLCDPIDCSPPGFSVHGISQTRILEWVAISSPGDLPGSRIEPMSPALAEGFFPAEPPGKPFIHITHSHKYSQVSDHSSAQLSPSVASDPLQPHGLQHARPPCPSPTPRAHSDSCPSSQRCRPTVSSSVVPFSSCLQSFPASGYFPMS